MEFTLATVMEFLKPLLEVQDLKPDDVFSVTFEPGGVEFTVYARNPDGSLVRFGDTYKMNAKFVNYLG